MKPTRVYFNSACPVCRAGIEFQRERLGDADIEWVDVHTENAAVCGLGADLEFVRERLHVVDEEDQLHVGAEAFAALWRKTPGQRGLGTIAGLPVLRTVFAWIYNGFARLLYRWNRWTGNW